MSTASAIACYLAIVFTALIEFSREYLQPGGRDRPAGGRRDGVTVALYAAAAVTVLAAVAFTALRLRGGG